MSEMDSGFLEPGERASKNLVGDPILRAKIFHRIKDFKRDPGVIGADDQIRRWRVARDFCDRVDRFA